MYTDDKNMATSINEFFTNIGKELSRAISPSDLEPLAYVTVIISRQSLNLPLLTFFP